MYNDGEMEDEIDKEMDVYMSKMIQPRMSPWGKQRVYNDYMKGMNTRDISLKYGILPERVAAIVWTREYFLKVVYPKCGETYSRMALDLEREYGEDFGFNDYGVDLNLLSYHEQGGASYSILRSAIDKAPPKKVKEKVEKVLGAMKNKRVFEVPIKHVGKGPGGYLLKELVCRRGKNSIMARKNIVAGVRKANTPQIKGYE